MDSNFQVTYLVKTTLNKNGEFYPSHETNKYFTGSVSNDLNEIFTDIFELHRFEGILGIEILDVELKRKSSEEQINLLWAKETLNSTLVDIKDF